MQEADRQSIGPKGETVPRTVDTWTGYYRALFAMTIHHRRSVLAPAGLVPATEVVVLMMVVVLRLVTSQGPEASFLAG